MASPRQLADLTDDLLGEILVRIASPSDLARAATACVSFHRLITDPTFLRRYRSLHPPLILGFVNGNFEGFQPAEAPHPSAPAGHDIARAANFSFPDYILPGRWDYWYYCDVRDGRVLLESCSEEEWVLPDLVVCDPLSRRYLLLPPIPVGQAHEQNLQCYDASLVPCADEDDEASFRVIMEMHCTTDLVVFIFSSGSGSWSASTSTSWDALSLSGLMGFSRLCFLCYAYGCFYWKVRSRNKLVKLNMNRMEFSTVNLPPGHDERQCIIVEEGDGRLGLFSHVMHETSVYYYTSMQNNGKSAIEWQMKNIIPLPNDYNALQIISARQRYIFIMGTSKFQYTHTCFTLEIKTMKIERVSQITTFGFLPYVGFPPSMSPRRI
ncbi:hypothetical protein BAE44_0014288 [Dichanthelium oligosanthes]|uniref:F-box protein AT5G49610-like beta-propeller domain-containing protein n=1 Tax=Dichanthelium oligosanthes TaxID=888268 RepID=A0A1E5VI13_9POAL|nr:hypothetical protein BAE44_0014288 [Dichanthelium oligosanthes]